MKKLFVTIILGLVMASGFALEVKPLNDSVWSRARDNYDYIGETFIPDITYSCVIIAECDGCKYAIIYDESNKTCTIRTSSIERYKKTLKSKNEQEWINEVANFYLNICVGLDSDITLYK